MANCPRSTPSLFIIWQFHIMLGYSALGEDTFICLWIHRVFTRSISVAELTPEESTVRSRGVQPEATLGIYVRKKSERQGGEIAVPWREIKIAVDVIIFKLVLGTGRRDPHTKWQRAWYSPPDKEARGGVWLSRCYQLLASGRRSEQPAVLAARLLALSLHLCRSSKGNHGTLSLPVKLQGQGVGGGRDGDVSKPGSLKHCFPSPERNQACCWRWSQWNICLFCFIPAICDSHYQPPFHNDSWYLNTVSLVWKM